MAFKTFERSRASTSEAMVSVTQFGQINLNNRTFRDFIKNKKCEHVELLYDPEREVIGIKPVPQKTPNSYNIRVNDYQNFAQISGISFLKCFKIPHETTKAYKASWNVKEKLIEVDLKT